MSFWTAVVVIFAIACGTWLRTQQIRGGGGSGLGFGGFGGSGRRERRERLNAREHELEEEVERMRERIAVLERIATDEKRGRDLAREIEQLRD